ncbi:MAG: RagB/SusD family nutrient uptake outer membrane protein [Bacteroidota bacterium]
MKKIKYILITLLVTVAFISCNEDNWLEEEPLDFYAPVNSFAKPSDFNSAVARSYQKMGELMHTQYSNGTQIMTFHHPSDVAHDNHGIAHHLNSYRDNLNPESRYPRGVWSDCYRIIFDCNTLLGRIDNEEVVFPDESVRTSIKAEATFLRGYSYRLLGILFGGVPIVLEEITAPKRDFVRASRDAVWDRVVSDLTFAEQNLPIQSELKEDGRLTKAAAQHALTEIYIIRQEWDKAISSASEVINDPEYALMTERFGTRVDEPGDVYWDLFRRGNKNHNGQGGLNTEAIWVDQFEYLVDGGGRANMMTRFLGAVYWQLTGDSDGKPLFFGHSSQHGGRGIGWLNPNPYVLWDIWDDPNDMRNSEYNIIRDIKANNPESAYFGQYIIESGAIDGFNNALNRWWSAIFAKTAPIGNFPDEVISNPETGQTNNGANQTFNDTYYFRLAETYLLRAEAYLGKGDQTNAAKDINTVRARANAAPVAAGDVDIYYILDERARELCFEEQRVITLIRLGLQKERVDEHNIMSSGYIDDYHKLWPIPASEIERNTEAVLEQNPGYN